MITELSAFTAIFPEFRITVTLIVNVCVYIWGVYMLEVSVIWQLKFIDCSIDHKCCYKRNEFLSTYCNVSGFSGTSISLDSQVPPPSSQIWPTSLAYVPKISRFYTIFWGSWEEMTAAVISINGMIRA